MRAQICMQNCDTKKYYNKNKRKTEPKFQLMREARMSNNNTNTCNRHLPLIFGEVSCVLGSCRWIFFDGQQQQQASPQLICVLFDSHHVPLVIRLIPLHMQTVLIF